MSLSSLKNCTKRLLKLPQRIWTLPDVVVRLTEQSNAQNGRIKLLERHVDAFRILHEFSAKEWKLNNASLRLESCEESNHAAFRSTICKAEHFDLPLYSRWCAELNERASYHRKQWEWVFMCQALAERDMLSCGKRGLGFGIGREPLSSLFAQKGCFIIGTDGPQEEATKSGWAQSAQFADNLALLNERGICQEEVFNSRVSYRTVDMNNIPVDLVGFDFCWSSCALEHLGSIANGIAFIKNSLNCLKPGGIAVHTTEFNLSSNTETIDRNSVTVLFRRYDLEQLVTELESVGHCVEPLDLTQGIEPVDNYVDIGPFYFEQSYGKGLPHLKLLLEGYVSTSVGLIIQKAS